MASKTFPLHSALKAQTHDAHMKMHRHPLLSPLQDKSISSPEYFGILRAFYEFHAAYEKAFKDIDRKFEHEFCPVDMLEKDFDALSLSRPEIVHMADVKDTCFSSYIGYLYVKQGSTLGGQYISAQLQKNLGLIKGENLFYFNGYGSDNGNIWRSFLSYIEDQSPHVKEEVAVKAAKNVFHDMDAFFKVKYTQSAGEA